MRKRKALSAVTNRAVQVGSSSTLKPYHTASGTATPNAFSAGLETWAARVGRRLAESAADPDAARVAFEAEIRVNRLLAARRPTAEAAFGERLAEILEARA